MSYICFNPKCRHHTPISEAQEHLPVINVPNGQVAEFSSFSMMYGPDHTIMTKSPYDAITRHPYTTSFGDRYYLCDTCHSAVEFGRKINAWNHTYSHKDTN